MQQHITYEMLTDTERELLEEHFQVFRTYGHNPYLNQQRTAFFIIGLHGGIAYTRTFQEFRNSLTTPQL